MKKASRSNLNETMSNISLLSHNSTAEPPACTSGRIRKPKAVFDPSDNYLPRVKCSLITGATVHHNTLSSERRVNKFKPLSAPCMSLDEPKDACIICKKKESKRPSIASKNPLINCYECQRKLHKICINVDFEGIESIPSNYKCYNCVTCNICNDKFINPYNEMITCCKCTKSFHPLCFPSKVNKIDNMRSWKCNKCQVYNQITNDTTLLFKKKIRKIIGSKKPTVRHKFEKNFNVTSNDDVISNFSQSTQNISHTDNIQHQILDNTSNVVKVMDNSGISFNPSDKHEEISIKSSDTVSVETTLLNTSLKSASTTLCFTPSNENFEDIPDVKDWSVYQVYEYFYKHFPKEAHILKDEEIDGHSLLLLKRSDIVKKLPIKLGPSLRIYDLILKIQTKLNCPNSKCNAIADQVKSLQWTCPLCNPIGDGLYKFLKTHREGLDHLTRDLLSVQEKFSKFGELVDKFSNLGGFADHNEFSSPASYSLAQNSEADTSQLKNMKNEIKELKRELNKKGNSVVAGNIRIRGLPFNDNENLVGIFSEICRNVSIPTPQVDNIFRLRKQNKDNKVNVLGDDEIIVKMHSPYERNFLLKSIAEYKRSKGTTLCLKHAGYNSDVPIYINEDLTPHNHRIFREALKIKKNGYIRSVYTLRGSVYIRKFDSEGPTLVEFMDELQQFFRG